MIVKISKSDIDRSLDPEDRRCCLDFALERVSKWPVFVFKNKVRFYCVDQYFDIRLSRKIQEILQSDQIRPFQIELLWPKSIRSVK